VLGARPDVSPMMMMPFNCSYRNKNKPVRIASYAVVPQAPRVCAPFRLRAIQGGDPTQGAGRAGDSLCAVASAVPAAIRGIRMLAFTPCHCQAMFSTVRLIFLAAASTRASVDVRSRLSVSPEPVSGARVSTDCI